MPRLCFALAGVIAVTAPVSSRTSASFDPFAFFAPTIRVTAADRQRIDAGQPMVRILTGRDREVVVFAATRIGIDGERLAAWVRRIEPLKKSALVPIIRRFSTPPAIEDLKDMTLPAGDLRDIRDCEPGDCGLKLTAGEIAALKPDLAGSGPEADARLQQSFRRLMLKRIQAYIDGGHPAIGGHADGQSPRPLHTEFSALLNRSPYLTEKLPHLATHLLAPPRTATEGVEWFLYWSQDQVRGSPVMTATHVAIVRGRLPAEPRVLVAGKQIFATHYMNASLSVTSLIGGVDQVPSYLVYINRTDVDVLSGFFSPMARMIIESRIRGEAQRAIVDLRKRLESGPPPGAQEP